MTAQPTTQACFQADQLRLRACVDRLSVLRHGRENYEELERTALYVEAFLTSCGYPVQNQYLQFKGRKYRNIIATLEGSRPELPTLLIGAHYDGNRNTPGADDNASGVAAMLEAARLLRNTKPARTVEFTAFTLEEPQTFTHIIRRGSRFFARQAQKRGAKYHGAVILECVGFTAKKQRGALLSRMVGIAMPKEGDFVAVVANGPSRPLMDWFVEAARRNVPALKTVEFAMPAQGYVAPQSRFSDHASFWERGYPAIMLNDTVMFRNPNYHRPEDLPATLDFVFMTDITTAVACFAASLSS
jgi:hypothetical protein